MRYEKKTKPANWTIVPGAKLRPQPRGKLPASKKAHGGIVRRKDSAERAVDSYIRRHKISAESKARRQERKLYKVAKREFLNNEMQNWICALPDCSNIATEVHHTRGRAGKLYLDTRYWIGVCVKCHQWIHTHMEEARSVTATTGSNAGLRVLCARGDWGRQL